MIVKTLKELYTFIKEGNTMEMIADYMLEVDEYPSVIECVDNEVFQDGDFDDMMEELNCSFVDDDDDSTIVITDGETKVKVPFIDYPNRFGDDLPDETVYDFSKIKLIK